MKQESGRSLIEVLGVMAIGAIMIAGTVAAYNAVRNRQIRTVASAELEQIAKNTRLLMEPRGSYEGVSVDYLIKSGALKNDKAPIGAADWSVTADLDGLSFSINLTGLSQGDCAYLTTARAAWASAIKLNGNELDAVAVCLTTGDNQVSFIVQ